MARLPLKEGWLEEWGEREKDDVMELNIVQSDREREREREREGIGFRGLDLESLTDVELNDKIERLKSSISIRGAKLPDKGEKLQLSLQKHIDERERRRDLQNPISERSHPVRTERHTNSERSHSTISSERSHSTISEYGRGIPVSHRSTVQQRELKPDGNNNADCTVNAFDDDLKLVSPRHKKLMENGQQHSVNGPTKNIRRSPRITPVTKWSVFYSPKSSSSNEGELSNSVTRNKKKESSGLSSILAEENGCSLSAGKRAASSSMLQNSSKKHSPLTPKSSSQKIVVVLDEEEEKPKQQNQRKKDVRIYYPERNHPECVEISPSDTRCLDSSLYLSSEIMNFYILYLQRSKSPLDGQKEDYHFFNTFFYSKLEEALDSYVKNEKGNAFAKLRRWFKGVNIFEKAYIFLPIHACQHWSLVIISIPAREDETGPIILHLDSLGLHSSKIIFSNVQSYLKAEWEHLNQEGVPAQVPIAENIWKDLPNKIQSKHIQVPQQENEYDCGLFVLFFMERFIEEAPPRLRREDLDKGKCFGRNWFQPSEASCLRGKIKRLLQKHFRDAEKSSQDSMNESSVTCVLEDE